MQADIALQGLLEGAWQGVPLPWVGAKCEGEAKGSSGCFASLLCVARWGSLAVCGPGSFHGSSRPRG